MISRLTARSDSPDYGIEKSFLYMGPLYLQAERNSFQERLQLAAAQKVIESLKLLLNACPAGRH